MRIIAYAYEAALHCPRCTARAFEVTATALPTWTCRDRDGNEATPIYSWQQEEYVGECCDDCFTEFE